MPCFSDMADMLCKPFRFAASALPDVPAGFAVYLGPEREPRGTGYEFDMLVRGPYGIARERMARTESLYAQAILRDMQPGQCFKILNMDDPGDGGEIVIRSIACDPQTMPVRKVAPPPPFFGRKP